MDDELGNSLFKISFFLLRVKKWELIIREEINRFLVEKKLVL